MQVLTNSRSAVLWAAHILLIRIQSVQRGTPVPDGPTAKVPVSLTVQLEQNLKGSIREKPGAVVNVSVIQYERTISRIFAVPGVWSNQSLESGLRLVVFSSNGAADLTSLLQDPLCKQLMPVSALPDVQHAIDAENDHLSLLQTISWANASPQSVGNIFARYLAAKATEDAPLTPETFDALIGLTENAALPNESRLTLLDELTSYLIERDDVSEREFAHLAMALFRVLAMPQTGGIHQWILERDLPGLLGLAKEKPRITARSVFRSHPEVRRQAEATIQLYQNQPEAKEIQKWLQEQK